MDLQSRIAAFSNLGNFINCLINNNMMALPKEALKNHSIEVERLSNLQIRLLDYYQNSNHHNPWFTQEFILFAIKDWAKALQEEKLIKWTSNYKIEENNEAKTIGVVMAGNLPLVGFHDYLSILISGNILLAKLSSDDAVLLPILHDLLSVIEPEMTNKASFTQGTLHGFDAIIATGSDNTSRYFEYYFGKYPHIIRRNRSGVAILSGNETEDDLQELSTDIMAYFGLGCRSISKLYVPRNYNFKAVFEAINRYEHLKNHYKFFNNYEYNKAIYLVNTELHRDTGYLLFKEDTAMSSPISVIYYEEYDDVMQLDKELDTRKQEIQCIIGANNIPYGQSQHPQLSDYADGVDTMAFLLTL